MPSGFVVVFFVITIVLRSIQLSWVDKRERFFDCQYSRCSMLSLAFCVVLKYLVLVVKNVESAKHRLTFVYRVFWLVFKART